MLNNSYVISLMICINLESSDPCFNLAVDEYILKNRKEDFLILGINDTSVIIGKHQVVHRETDTRFIAENDIPVIRRISGGGTVFHDKGNLNFSFILNSYPGKQIDFRKYTQPVISFLSSVGVDAKFEGKNDLRVEGLKISGNAEHVYRNRVLHHGTLLFDADLELLKGSIRKDAGKYITRAVSSTTSSVTNLNVLIKNIKDVHEFRYLMFHWFLMNYPGAGIGKLSEDEIEKIKLLAFTKYGTWEWNYGYGPDYSVLCRLIYRGSETICSLFVRDGIIRDCETEGPAELAYQIKKLCGCRHMVTDMVELFSKEGFWNKGFDIFDFF